MRGGGGAFASRSVSKPSLAFGFGSVGAAHAVDEDVGGSSQNEDAVPGRPVGIGDVGGRLRQGPAGHTRPAVVVVAASGAERRRVRLGWRSRLTKYDAHLRGWDAVGEGRNDRVDGLVCCDGVDGLLLSLCPASMNGIKVGGVGCMRMPTMFSTHHVNNSGGTASVSRDR